MTWVSIPSELNIFFARKVNETAIQPKMLESAYGLYFKYF